MLLGFVQTGTENATACALFLRSLVDRGLQIAEGLLVVLDGGKGLRRAVGDVFGDRAHVQQCVWHKRENVVAYLPKHLQVIWRAKLQQAYRQPTYAAAHGLLQRLHGDVRRLSDATICPLPCGTCAPACGVAPLPQAPPDRARDLPRGTPVV